MKDLEFVMGDLVFLKVLSAKGNMRFRKRGKLSPFPIGPFEVLKRVDPVTYHLTLPQEFTGFCDVFYV